MTTKKPVLKMKANDKGVLQMETTGAAGSLGIENIKEVFTTIIEIGVEIADLVKDFSFEKALSLGFKLAGLRTAVPIFKQALKEFKDGLTPAEAKQIADHFKVKFDIENDELEAKIENVVSLIPDTFDWIADGIGLFGKWRTSITAFRKPKELSNAA